MRERICLPGQQIKPTCGWVDKRIVSALPGAAIATGPFDRGRILMVKTAIPDMTRPDKLLAEICGSKSGSSDKLNQSQKL